MPAFTKGSLSKAQEVLRRSLWIAGGFLAGVLTMAYCSGPAEAQGTLLLEYQPPRIAIIRGPTLSEIRERRARREQLKIGPYDTPKSLCQSGRGGAAACDRSARDQLYDTDPLWNPEWRTLNAYD